MKVFWVPESENPDDDKIYFFFRESAVEASPALGRRCVSRVGQICRVRSPEPVLGPAPPAALGRGLIPSHRPHRTTWAASAAWSTSGPRS